ncbi:hypothetical protein QM012_007917 [Aureobasidium pullulans]|uniref:Uncharacterized protein n=1 Tax=Aureobasidium pullulans TaxID=5580 RepID=A0ABR0TL24_AURPU
MLAHISLYVSLVRAAFALQIPRQASSSYSNSSTAVRANASTSAALGAVCCQLYAPGVGLNLWYADRNVSVNNGTIIVEYEKYNNTIVPTSTITIPPTSTLYPGAYLADIDGPAIIPGIPTDINGLYYGGAYDATMVEAVKENSTVITTQIPFMAFSDFYAFFGHVDDAGICMGTNRFEPLSTYTVSSVAQSWFSDAADFPFPPNSDIYYNGIDYTSFFVDYNSYVSTQTDTWNQRVVVTEMGDSMFAWLTKQPSVLSQVPHIASCAPVSAAGAPQLHIRVSYLTSSSAVTSTTNAMYLTSAATTSAVPASKTPSSVTSTEAPILNVPSPTIVEVSAEQPSDEPAQSAKSQGAGATSEVSSAGPANQATQSTTIQGEGASSDQLAPSIVAGAPSDGPSQQSAQSTVTKNAAAPSVAPEDESLSVNPTQSATGQGVPSIAPSDQPGASPGQTTTVQDGGHGGSSQADSNTIAVQSSVPVVVVIGSATATALLSNSNPDELTIPNTGGHIVNFPANTRSAQAPDTAVVGSSQPTLLASAYAIEGQTLQPGGPAIEVSGTTFSIQESGGIVVNGNTMPISTVVPDSSSPPVPVVIGGIAATPVASDEYVIAGQTLSRGGPAVEISRTTYSLPPSANNVIINGQAAPISSMQASLGPPATVVIGGVTAKPESSGAYYLIADQTLSPGDSAIQVSGVTYSLPSLGANIVINGAASIMAQSSAVVFGSATAVPLLAGGYVVGSQTITPGGSAVEMSGTVYSLPVSGSSVVIDGKETAIQAITFNDAVLTLGSQAFTAVAASATPLVIASQTLIPGGSDITVSGATFSLPPGVTGSIVVNGETTSLEIDASGGVGLSSGSVQLLFTPLTSGIIVASQTLYPGGPAIVVQGKTLSIPVDGTAVVIESGTTTTTKGLGGYVWQGIAAPTSTSASHLTSGVEANSNTAMLSVSSTRAGVDSTQAAVSTGTGSVSSAHTSTSDASGQQPASSFKPATMALVVCVFVIVLW